MPGAKPDVLLRGLTKGSIQSQLAGLFEKNQTKRRGTRNAIGRPPDQIDIIDPSLCDDVLNYLAPSLEPYKGCDIIDIHPGACLWSQKLHEFLKPRCHLLMEPQEKYYTPFIKPLLDQQGSKYTYTTRSGANPTAYWSAFDDIFDGKLLPKREPLGLDDPQRREPNRSLLVTGIIHRQYQKKVWLNRVHYSNMIVSQMAFASQTNTMFHAFGLARMLFWLPQEVESALYPRSLGDKASLNVTVDMATKIASIVSPQKETPSRARERTKMEFRADQVLSRMEQLNMHIPEGRRNAEHQAAIDRRQSGRLIPKAHGWHPDHELPLTLDDLMTETVSLEKDTEEFTQRFINRRFAQFSRAKEPKEVILSRVPYDFLDDMMVFHSASSKAKSGWFMVLKGRQLRVEREFARNFPSLSVEKRHSLAERIRGASENLRRALESLERSSVNKLLVAQESEYAAVSDPSPLPFEERQFEPLLGRAQDFWPNYDMCLLDLTPRKENLASDITSASEATGVMRDLVKNLFTRTRDPLPVALDRVAPSAGADLVPKAPSITDPSRSGRLDATDLTARSLTREMLRELMIAYLEWPFRPSDTDLATDTEAAPESGEGTDEVNEFE